MDVDQYYYVIEFYTGYITSKSEEVISEWDELLDVFGRGYKFNDEKAAIRKAIEISKQGMWGQPIRLRVMKRIVKIVSEQICELDPDCYYIK